MQAVLNDPEKFRCQIIYTQIDRDKKGKPSFRNFYFNHNPNLYFNPASTVKLPLALLSLQKLNRLKNKGIDRTTTIQIDSSYAGQKKAYVDTTSENGLPSIGHYIKKALLVSDNDAYNRMYQFVGQQEINRDLHGKGYINSRIIRQFMRLSEDGNRHTNQVRFLDKAGKTFYVQLPAYNTDSFDFGQRVLIGKGYRDGNDSLVNAPFDFTRHNKLPLKDLQQMLESVIFPLSVPQKKGFTLSSNDRKFLLQYLSQLPSETNYPNYDTSVFYDTYVKFFFDDSSRKLPKGVRVFNKVGWAYGFLTDVSYVADLKNKVEFMLSATVYVNEDSLLNDDHYDYDSIGRPFLYEVGQQVYDFEKRRRKRFPPDFKDIALPYETKNWAERKSMVTEVDN